MPWQSLCCAKPSSPQSPHPPPVQVVFVPILFPQKRRFAASPMLCQAAAPPASRGLGRRSQQRPAGRAERLLLGGMGHIWAWLKDTQEPLPGT